jgi:hypothetical protein
MMSAGFWHTTGPGGLAESDYVQLRVADIKSHDLAQPQLGAEREGDDDLVAGLAAAGARRVACSECACASERPCC